MSPVFIVVNDDFIKLMENLVICDKTSKNCVGRFNNNDRKEVNEAFENIQLLNLQAIASVCHTDSQSVELVLSEILSTVADQAKQGKQMRLNFKCGWLVF
jgi:hypothetical protein